MAAESKNNIVKTIFERGVKKEKISSLFGASHSPRISAQEEALKETKADKAESVAKSQPKERGLLNLSGWFKKSSPIGLDIGAYAIKIAQIFSEHHKVKLSKLILEEWPAHLLENPSRDLKALKEFLKDIFKKHNVRGPVYINAPQDTVHMKGMSLPKMPLSEVEQAVRWEMKQTHAQEKSGFSFDYTILNQGKHSYGETLEVMTMSSSRKDILERVDLLESLGLKVLAVEPEVCSLLAALLFNQAIGVKEVVLLLDIGEQSTSLSVVRNREICFTRMLNFSARGLKTMAKEAVLAEFDNLASAIGHTFKYYSYQLMKSQITQFHKLILAGGGAGFPLLVSFLEDRLKVPIEMANPLAGFDIIKGSNLGNQALKENAARLGVAIGLALRAVEE